METQKPSIARGRETEVPLARIINITQEEFFIRLDRGKRALEQLATATPDIYTLKLKTKEDNRVRFLIWRITMDMRHIYKLWYNTISEETGENMFLGGGALMWIKNIKKLKTKTETSRLTFKGNLLSLKYEALRGVHSIKTICSAFDNVVVRYYKLIMLYYRAKKLLARLSKRWAEWIEIITAE